MTHDHQTGPTPATGTDNIAQLRADDVYGPILFPPDGTGPLDEKAYAAELIDLLMIRKSADHAVRLATGERMSGVCRLGGNIYSPEGITDAHNDWLSGHDDDVRADHLKDLGLKDEAELTTLRARLVVEAAEVDRWRRCNHDRADCVDYTGNDELCAAIAATDAARRAGKGEGQ
jgi:hypothetical protein